MNRELAERLMRRAIELARRGEGRVEPNPMVGCVVAQGARIVGEGWHDAFGGPHAEVHALAAAGSLARGADLYVSLEPCCHSGKTPPCTDAIIAAGIRRVFVAMRDPFALVNGKGLAALAAAGIAVEAGIAQAEAAALLAPYHKLLRTGRPWIIAKWAMTLDGKLATRTGDSQWISNDASRAVVHALRGRVDAIVVGRGTVLADDPLLTARPAGPRIATRVVLASRGDVPNGQLLATARQQPVLIAAAESASAGALEEAQAAGCEVILCPGENHAERLDWLLAELGRRRFTNVLFEGGSRVFGCLSDQDWIDEVHVFVSPRTIGGDAAPSPLAGTGAARIADAAQYACLKSEILDGNWHFHGRRIREGA